MLIHVVFSQWSSASVTDGMSNTLMLGERPPLIFGADKCYNITGTWAYSYSNTACGAQGIYDGASADGGSPPPTGNPVGPACPQVAYLGAADLNHCCSFNHFGSFHVGGASARVSPHLDSAQSPKTNSPTR